MVNNVIYILLIIMLVFVCFDEMYLGWFSADLLVVGFVVISDLAVWSLISVCLFDCNLDAAGFWG